MIRDISSIRNIGIIAHIDAGKTTTTERILFYAGEIHNPGNVDDGNTVTDFDPEEAQRGITIYSAAISCSWRGCSINIIDTPGHVDFTAEVQRSLRVLDGGVVVFSAVEGVEAQSETVWRQADGFKVPRICFINKLDRIGANFERVIGQITERLQGVPLVLSIPIGSGPATNSDGFTGIVDLLRMEAVYFDKESKGREIRREPIPAACQDLADDYRVRLIESVAMLDDDVFAVYDETGDIPLADLNRLIRQGTITGQFQPLLCGASLDYIGVQPILDAVVDYLPSPLDVPPVEGRHPKKENIEVRKPNENEPFAGLVFKVQVDEHSELYFVRVYSGVLKSRSRMLNPRTGEKELISQLWKMQADSRVKLDEAGAGDIVGVVGPKSSVTGDTLCEANQPILLESITFPETVISMAIEPETSADRKKLEETLKLLAKQDPTFRAKVSEETGQTIVSGMGELHLEIISKRMERDFHLKMRIHKPRVTYRETICKAVEFEEVFERQAGATSLYALIKLRAEPLEGAQSVVVENKMKPGAFPAELTQVLIQAMNDESKSGGTVGYPLMNMKLQVLGAGFREGETNEIAVRAAASSAVRRVLDEAGVMLLEPVMKLEVVTPNDFVGNVTADLNSRRASILNTGLRGNLVVIEAEVPLSGMFGYSTQVRSLSQGRASYSMEPLRFAPAPDSVLKTMLGE
ncbi:translation elongation factor G [Planctopirus limnophila DSM 3776]|uniref:Elongation factor G n=1 Tax=Planctopirus limnophila (strain ATCC 43296 / DSM 3776 / IFAM 1008 / Mu 290) TaxID=521674 RepID=D5SQ72_PLAL2|nr:elongation factor G [Planctopirus limnophila]ADG66324.1 translation elongation factor G [Planctopirus limnophila DSM 3776]